MSKIDDGGAAFPYYETGDFGVREGMSLRDYFAAKAMPSIYHSVGSGGFGRVASLAYDLADAMLAAREAGKPEQPVREVLSDDLSKCQRAPMEAGKPYPKTCPVCGLGGKCKRDQQPGGDGWVEWNGGECPVPKGASFFIRFRDGEEFDVGTGEGLTWNHEGNRADIIAYRIVSNGDQK